MLGDADDDGREAAAKPENPAAGGEAAVSQEPPEEAEAKIIVRSNGTVTYVGKDIAYQLWKFGLAGARFPLPAILQAIRMGTAVGRRGERRTIPPRRNLVMRCEVFNVIDARQAYCRTWWWRGCARSVTAKQAEQSMHFAYKVVALTPRCAAEMGYEIPRRGAERPYIEVSGRKGLGVKADDLMDQLRLARAEVDARQPERRKANERRLRSDRDRGVALFHAEVHARR